MADVQTDQPDTGTPELEAQQEANVNEADTADAAQPDSVGEKRQAEEVDDDNEGEKRQKVEEAPEEVKPEGHITILFAQLSSELATVEKIQELLSGVAEPAEDDIQINSLAKFAFVKLRDRESAQVSVAFF